MAALEIRKDRTPAVLRKLAKADERVARRILAIANALDGIAAVATDITSVRAACFLTLSQAFLHRPI